MIFKIFNFKKFSLIIKVIALQIPIFIILFLPNHYFIHPNNKLTITTLDVGNGDCTIIKFPNNESMIIDGGGSLKKDHGEYIANRIIIPFLKHRNIPMPKTAVLSHPHDDHLLGLISLNKKSSLKKFWTIPKHLNKKNKQHVKDFFEILDKNETKIIYKHNQSKSFEISGVKIKFLNPDNYIGNKLSLNNNSIVMELKYGNFCYLFTGDIEKETEEFLIKSNKLSQCDVIKAPHHGSSTSSTQGFINKLSPKIVVITTGSKNKLKHASKKIVNRYKKSGAYVLQSDIHGAVEITSDGKLIELKCTLKSCSELK